MYKELTYTLTLTGIAETKEGAFNKIFGQVKTSIAKQIPDLVVRIEPQEVEVISAKETLYTERFLGFFFPRQRTRYEIQAKISVRLGVVEVSKIAFTREAEHASQSSPVKQLLGQR